MGQKTKPPSTCTDNLFPFKREKPQILNENWVILKHPCTVCFLLHWRQLFPWADLALCLLMRYCASAGSRHRFHLWCLLVCKISYPTTCYSFMMPWVLHWSVFCLPVWKAASGCNFFCMQCPLNSIQRLRCTRTSWCNYLPVFAGLSVSSDCIYLFIWL